VHRLLSCLLALVFVIGCNRPSGRDQTAAPRPMPYLRPINMITSEAAAVKFEQKNVASEIPRLLGTWVSTKSNDDLYITTTINENGTLIITMKRKDKADELYHFMFEIVSEHRLFIPRQTLDEADTEPFRVEWLDVDTIETTEQGKKYQYMRREKSSGKPASPPPM
jgi:hypothetical protein